MPILDFANPLYTFSTANSSYTTTQECWLLGNISTVSSTAVYIDNVSVGAVFRGNVSSNEYSAVACGGDIAPIRVGVGSVIRIAGLACPNLHVFKTKN